jgi:hypothetical protein
MYQLLVYADVVNLLGDNIDTINKNTQALIDTFKQVGLEVNTERTKHMLLSRHQNSGKIHNIKRRMNSDNACYQSVQNLLSSRLLSKNVKIRIYKTIILPVVLYGYETWSLTLMEKNRLRVFKNRVLRNMSWPKRTAQLAASQEGLSGM